MGAWPNLLVLLVAGYLAMTRSFAYIGFPPAKLFIGEIAIAAFILSKPRAIIDRWACALRQASPLGGIALALCAFLAYGFFELVRGFSSGYPVVLALQGFAFHYYAICFFIGLWAGSVDCTLLRRMIRVVAWANGVYGLLFILILNRVSIMAPGTTDVPLFGQPAGSAIVVLGLLCLEPRPVRVWHLLLLNAFVMLAVQVRGEYLGFAVGLVLWGLLARRFRRLMAGCAAIALLLVAGLVSDFRMPAPRSRGGTISTRDIVGRVLAPIDPELAAEYTADARSVAGTATWRIVWWRAIWENIHVDTATALIGEGFGYPLADLVGYKERDIRTPHSVFFYALSYGGWIGVALFTLLQLALARVLWRAFRASGVTFGLVFWAMFCAGALVGNAFETPFGAIPFYLLTGMAAAPVLLEVRHHARPIGAQLLSTARG